MQSVSVIIPAYDEERALPETLRAVWKAVDHFQASGLGEVEVIVVDNASRDSTADVAIRHGASVVSEPVQGIGRARNAGARASRGRFLFFLDADTVIPPHALTAIHTALAAPDCIGGAPAVRYDYRKRTLRPYMAMWAAIARTCRMAQGVGQFASVEAFQAVGGYDETLQMAEDTDFYRRLQRHARSRGKKVRHLDDVTVVPSSRRLDQWPVWKTVMRTNPLVTRLFLRSHRFWRDWHDDTVR